MNLFSIILQVIHKQSGYYFSIFYIKKWYKMMKQVHEILLKVEEGLSCLLGLSSPWSVHVKVTVVYTLYVLLLYLIPLAGIFHINAGIDYRNGSINTWDSEYYILSVFSYYVYAVETYTTIFTYYFRNRKIGKFVSAYFKVYTCLEKTININDCNELNKKNIFKLISLFLICVCKLSLLLYRLVYTYYSSLNLQLLVCFHGIVMTTMCLQWALTIHSLEIQFAKVKGLMKNTFKSSNCMLLTATNNELSPKNNDTFRKKNITITLEKVDSVINVTRTLAEKYCLVNEYYGLHVGFYVSGLVYQVLKHSYGIWYCMVNSYLCDNVRHFIRYMVAICNFITILILATISGSANKKMNKLQEYLDKLITFNMTDTDRTYLYQFALELKHTSLEMCPLGLYKLNLKLVTSVCATTITYIIILIQYSQRKKLLD